MAQQETGADTSTESAIPNPWSAMPNPWIANSMSIPTEFVEMGKKRVEAMIDVQKELFGTFEKLNRDLVARAKSEADLASDLAAKLMAAHSVPETATVYQEWIGKRIKMFAEDRQRLFAHSQELMKAGARLSSNGSGGGST
jgi:Phasin protein